MVKSRKPAPRNRAAGGKPRYGLWLLGLLAFAIAAAIWWYRAPINGYAGAGTAYAARVGCSCRFVAGRDLASCESDLIAGMEMISLSDDEDARSVTASFPLVATDTATYREGYGCVLQRWEG